MLNAEATKDKVDAELADLQKTLKNIEEARPFEDLTVVCIILGIEWGWGVDGVMRDLWIRGRGRTCRGLQYLILLDMEILRYPPPSHSGRTFAYIMPSCSPTAPFLRPPAMFWDGS